ncbi:helix-turn-helix transcriptional regulator [Psychrosphaera aquimarina]|uniref:Helix-turn-helix transcriptional regulator n=1 Tax=Psychrosphaera aquimarina TaxID=2044854 RepID=A0ABU3QYS0_9GAMM|nr:helix-turn-helix transcriptional regulator [Psychrosphaera aquimarina]MDU0112596.1 helix-turn-helix transcriptional regulator [Psychrosphaera aquimarina]
MEINAELIKNQRTERNWTQQHLADACGVSLRTIQRVERYGNAANETVMALASVFQIEQSEIIIPETPVVEITAESEEGVSKVVNFIVTLLSGIVIGAALVMFINNL